MFPLRQKVLKNVPSKAFLTKNKKDGVIVIQSAPPYSKYGNADCSTAFKDYDCGYIHSCNTTFDFGAWCIGIPTQKDIGSGGKDCQYTTPEPRSIATHTLVRSVRLSHTGIQEKMV